MARINTALWLYGEYYVIDTISNGELANVKDNNIVQNTLQRWKMSIKNRGCVSMSLNEHESRICMFYAQQDKL